MKITVEGTDIAMLEHSMAEGMSAAELMRHIQREITAGRLQVVSQKSAAGMVTLFLELMNETEHSVLEEPKSSHPPYRLPTRHLGARSDLDLTRLAHVDEDAQ